MRTVSLSIFDETLRDGEQQAGIHFSAMEKQELSGLIAATGVSDIDIMPVSMSSEATLLAKLVEQGMEAFMCPAVMLGKKHIDQAKQCGVKKIILFSALSDRLMMLRDPQVKASPLLNSKTMAEKPPHSVIDRVRRSALDRIVDCLRYATSPEIELQVDFAAEDASRADSEFLSQCISECSPYLRNFLVCDTVGCCTPTNTYNWVNHLVNKHSNVEIGVHFHNDMGLALENTLQAVLAGATCVSGTFNGIGERAGNVALEQVLWALKVRFGVVVEGINYSAIELVLEKLDKLGAIPERPYSDAARRHETGIHVNSLLKDRGSYCAFAYDTPIIWFGKNSGASNYRYLFEKLLGHPQDETLYATLRDTVKNRSLDQGTSFSGLQVLQLIASNELPLDKSFSELVKNNLASYSELLEYESANIETVPGLNYGNLSPSPAANTNFGSVKSASNTSFSTVEAE